MPLYDYGCDGCCHEFEITLPMKKAGTIQRCPKCGGSAQRIFIIGHGGIQCDSEGDVKWLKSACRNLLPDGHKPLETRGEYKRYLKEKGIVPRA